MDPDKINQEFVAAVGLTEDHPYSTEIGWALKAVEFWRAGGEDRFLTLEPVSMDRETGAPGWRATAFESIGSDDSRMVVTGVHTSRTPAEAVCVALTEVVQRRKEIMAAAPPRKRRGAA